MGGDLYTTAGGSLKIKGVAGSKVEKKKKKKKKVEGEAREGGKADTTATDSPHEAQDDAKALSAVEDVSTGLDADSGKTEAERRHEDLRRQRLLERVKKEGVKTHKERVEELNKYLSTLSEHHDMPRIGPG